MSMSGAAIQAVIFDLDGLLVVSEPLQLRAWDAYLRQHGAALTPALLQRMLGLRLVDSAALVQRELRLPVAVQDVVRDRDELFLASVPGNIHAMPGAGKLVDTLHAHGTRLALATSGHRRYVDLALAGAGLRGVFEVEVTGELVEHGKPAPDTYLRACELLHLPPAACLALEDAPNGVASAKAAGLWCIAVPDPMAERAQFSAADAIVRSLDEVVDALAVTGGQL